MRAVTINCEFSLPRLRSLLALILEWCLLIQVVFTCFTTGVAPSLVPRLSLVETSPKPQCLVTMRFEVLYVDITFTMNTCTG